MSEALSTPISLNAIFDTISTSSGTSTNPGFKFNNLTNTGMFLTESPYTFGFTISGIVPLQLQATQVNLLKPIHLIDTVEPTPLNNTEGYIYKKAGSDNLYWKTLNGGVANLSIGTVAYPLLASDGSASTPSYSWTNATSTGLYLSTNNTINFSAAGSNILQLTQTGLTSINALDMNNQDITNVNTFTCLTAHIGSFFISGTSITLDPNNTDIVIAPNGTGGLLLNGQPTSANHVATKQYADNRAQGIDAKGAVSSATTTNVSLAAGGDIEDGKTLEGVVLTTGMRVLIKNQTVGSENGIYDVQAAGVAPTRSTDFPAGTSIVTKGAFTSVINGNLAGTSWVLNNADPVNVGTDALTFVQFSSNSYDNLGNHTATQNLSMANFSIQDLALGEYQHHRFLFKACPQLVYLRQRMIL